MCRSSLPEISPFTCRLAPNRAVEPDGVVLSGRMASVLMAIPSVFAEAGLATGAAVSGGFAVVGCCVSGFFSPHILPLHGQRHLLLKLVGVFDRGGAKCGAKRNQKHSSRLPRNPRKQQHRWPSRLRQKRRE